MTTAAKNGDRARDRVTGFEGVVTGRCEYITGCTQLLIAPPAKDGAFVEPQWYDVDRCEVVEAGAVSLRMTVAGPDKAAPKR